VDLKEEIKALTGSAIAINKAFESVRLKLLATDKKGYQKNFRAAHLSIHLPCWVELQKVHSFALTILFSNTHNYWYVSAHLAFFHAPVALLILALMTLRSLPPPALQTVHWTTFLPHI
jgi:hypothetical protein